MSPTLGARYDLEVWDPVKCKYKVLWSGTLESMAMKMLDKPYNQAVTRRLVKTTREAIARRQGRKRDF